MCYPTNGKNHHEAVKDENDFSLKKEVFENYYNKKIKIITHIGGTKSKVDILIIFEDDSKIKVSLKSKKSIYSGSFDYVNSSNFGSVKIFFKKTFEIYDKYNNSGNLEGYDFLKTQISEDLNCITSEEITKLFLEHVINKYNELSLTISDKKTKKIYFDVKPKIFDFVKNGGLLKLKNTGKNTMSYSIIGYDSDENEYDFNLRIRVHLNNGKTKWVGDGSSVIVFKFQQDSVHKIIWHI